MAAIQAVIFLLLILLVWAFDITIRWRETQAVNLTTQLSDGRFTNSEAAAALLREHHARDIAQNELSLWLALPVFNMERIDMVKETMPTGVALMLMDMDEHGATLTFQTTNLSLVDIHREAWLASGMVDRVQLVSAVSAEAGKIQYILNLHWQDGQDES